jgi:NAD-specific glutamate dehydrogenase
MGGDAVSIRDLVTEAAALAARSLEGERAEQAQRFLRIYYEHVPHRDRKERGTSDLYGAAMSHLGFARTRAPEETKVRVYTPDLEQHGWQSTHSVVEVVTDDMPFLVDSLTMELSRRGHGIHLVIHPGVRVRRDAQGRLVEVVGSAAASTEEDPTTAGSSARRSSGRRRPRGVPAGGDRSSGQRCTGGDVRGDRGGAPRCAQGGR